VLVTADDQVDKDVSSPRTVTPSSQQLADTLRVCSDRISIDILTAIETSNRLNIRTTGPYLLEELEIGKF
jgi:hypothetical protein